MSALAMIQFPPQSSSDPIARGLEAPTETRFELAQPSHVRSQNLTRAEKATWRTLCRYRNPKNEAWPKNATIADETDFSVRTVQRALAGLIKKGWISVPNGTAGGQHKGTFYVLHPEASWIVRSPQNNTAMGDTLSPVTHDKMAPERVTKTTSTGDKDDSAIRKNLSIEPLKREGTFLGLAQYDENFLEFYANYTSATGVPVNEFDLGNASRQWRFLSLEDQILAKAFIPQLIDGRPPNRYQLPKNYLADRPWSRFSIRKEPAPIRGLKAGEIE